MLYGGNMSSNISKQKRERMMQFLSKLKEEHKDDDSMLIALGEIEAELNAKKYGLVWEEHEEAVDVMMKDNIPVFTECANKEIHASDSDDYNFLLEGDNLHSLRLLEKTHKGKIDVIYIDPPYNTLKDGFTYNDTLVDGNDLFRHSKWLSFMRERLKSAYNLLSTSGVVFISIDENEFAQVKMLCDTIFGEINFIECIVWNKRIPKNDKGIGNIHEYILTYAKSPDFKYKFMVLKEGLQDIEDLILECKQKKLSVKETESELKKLYKKKKYDRAITLYNSVDDNYRVWGKINMSWPNGNTFGPRYDVLHPKSKMPVRVPDRGWRWSEDTFLKAVDYENAVERFDGSFICGSIWFSKDENLQPSSIKYLDEVNRMLLRSIISLKSDGSIELEKCLGEKSKFAYPKPISLIQTLIDSITYNNKSCTILDFFAGSGTTAQAVLELNKEDGGNRKFILCTNNENGICENITYQRIKTVITGKREDGSDYSDGIPANLKYYRTDFVSKNEEYLSDALLEHVTEMIQLEHGIKLDGKRYITVMNDDEADRLAEHWSEYPDVKALYVSKNVLFTTEQNDLFKDVDIYIIPDYYFNFELREVGETW